MKHKGHPLSHETTLSGSLHLRVATHRDVAGLNELIARSAAVLSRNFYTDIEIASAIRFVFGVDTSLIDDATYFVAERDGVAMGCGGWSRRRTLYGGDQRPVGPAELLDPAREAAKIRAFFVAPEAARQGVGRALLARSEAEARAHGFSALELMATLPGVPFYAALGFAPVEDVVDPLPDGVPLRFVKMRRLITPAG